MNDEFKSVDGIKAGPGVSREVPELDTALEIENPLRALQDDKRQQSG